MLLFYQVATRLSLITCWRIVELQDDNKLLKQLVTGLLSSTTLYNLSTSWEQALRTHSVDKLSGQHCYKSAAECRVVTTCTFLRVYCRSRGMKHLYHDMENLIALDWDPTKVRSHLRLSWLARFSYKHMILTQASFPRLAGLIGIGPNRMKNGTGDCIV
jgi:hypothetical protein